jgi:hypothetical protein
MLFNADYCKDDRCNIAQAGLQMICDVFVESLGTAIK